MSKIATWHSQRDGFQEALQYINGRKSGEITSFKTPFPAVNSATVDGLEWGSLTVICGRPGTGKTLIKDQIIREGIRKNCTLAQYESARFPFRILEFQLEMISRVSALREFSSIIQKSYKYLCSADGTVSEDDIELCYEYAKKRVKYPIDVIDKPCTVTVFENTIRKYMEDHAVTENDEKVYMNTIITLDHSILLLKDKSAGEKDKVDMLYNLGAAITDLKKEFPIAFIILSQLNRNVDSAERAENGTYGNYVLDSDVFGGDALLQHADNLLGLNRPGSRFINHYGPDKYIIQDDTIVVMHFLKCRNGETGLCFFQSEYDKMKLKPISDPPKQTSKPSFKKSTP